MFDDPKPDEVVQGANGRTCTVKEFNSMTDDERRVFIGAETKKEIQNLKDETRRWVGGRFVTAEEDGRA